MSLRTFQRITIMGLLALGAIGASGCDDEETTPAGDAGGNGGGNDANAGGSDANGGAADAGKDAGEEDSGPGPGMMCGDKFCPKPATVLGQCCGGAEMDVCSINLQAPGQPSVGCFPENAPGKDSASCLAVLNKLEPMGGKDPNFFEIMAGPMTTLKVPACCTEQGVCGVDGNKSDPFGNLGVGCIPATSLMPMGGGGGGAPPTEPGTGLPLVPNLVCNPADGTPGCIPTSYLGRTIPPYILGACAAEIDMMKGCIKAAEVVVRGCGENMKWDRTSPAGICVDNVAANVFGCVGLTATSPFLANFPNGACGCGVDTKNTNPPGPMFCLSYTATEVCGKVPACTVGADCDPDGADGPATATQGTCLDVKGTGGTVDGPAPGGGTVKGDDIGDYCMPKMS